MLEEAGHGLIVGLLRLREASLVDTVANLVVHPPVHLLRQRLLLAGLQLEVQTRVADAFDVIKGRVQDLHDFRRLVVDHFFGLQARTEQQRESGGFRDTQAIRSCRTGEKRKPGRTTSLIIHHFL